ncbi:uncharacterized protein MONOS_16356 [Monocercomonoides exilis]|uniref:uncharacterized protein n=1 Tax=Monocercomonoides exilis TaxID=2049356 RepID=UPI00355A7FC5|nr:hypothetical protein MONOS_16356 [Monocercomonoides exilis]|eukprot:MONOS_16356.1-p1 / transcript=MONOS_16356.1 / gene=MONOS_16356 / organism=Monocercomonoides_exilis_PA203 / gene_product=unspecified product / transcript_product=unspecified product / location=Mono_scaffold01669:1356-3481(-) / protein_length=366 / sequence_SO=supercontig / SO=protein_coding / is_pseudo=false
MFEKMIIEEETIETNLVDLCECYSMNIDIEIPETLTPVIMSCLLRVALRKDESKETRNEVEMALVSLGNIGYKTRIEQEVYLNEIMKIILNHQEHNNLTRLAYQSAWQFLTQRLSVCGRLEEVIVKELHFAREAANEMEHLIKYVDWTPNEDKVKKEMVVGFVKRWIAITEKCISRCYSLRFESDEILECLVRLHGASKENHKSVSKECIRVLGNMIFKKSVRVKALLKSGAVEVILEEMRQSAFENDEIEFCKSFIFQLYEALSITPGIVCEEEDLKTIREELYERLEEEGFEDIIVSDKPVAFPFVLGIGNAHMNGSSLPLNGVASSSLAACSTRFRFFTPLSQQESECIFFLSFFGSGASTV